MAKDQNTFAKRARETEKKRKAEAKRERRRVRKEEPSEELAPGADAVDANDIEPEDEDIEP